MHTTRPIVKFTHKYTSALVLSVILKIAKIGISQKSEFSVTPPIGKSLMAVLEFRANRTFSPMCIRTPIMTKPKKNDNPRRGNNDSWLRLRGCSNCYNRATTEQS